MPQPKAKAAAKPPSPPSSPSPSPAAAGSSTGSSAATDPPAGAFVADAGPAFDPGAHAEDDAPKAPASPDVIDVQWDQAVVEGLLTAKGTVLHTLVGKGEDDWLYLKSELQAIGGPLTRILNRIDVTRAAAGTGDEIALLIGLTGYTLRSVAVRKAAIDAAKPAEEDTALAAPTFPDAAPADAADLPPIPDTPGY